MPYRLSTCVSSCRGGKGCTPRTCVSACREGRGCAPCNYFSASREGRGCTERTYFSAYHEGGGCTPRSRLSPCRGGRGCTPRTCISPCHEDTGCTPCRGVSSSYRVGTVSFPLGACEYSARTPHTSTVSSHAPRLVVAMEANIEINAFIREPFRFLLFGRGSHNETRDEGHLRVWAVPDVVRITGM